VTSLSVADFAQSDEVYLTDLRVYMTHHARYDIFFVAEKYQK
jgi:hypothetical protein